ncbi:MAG: bifunctional methylenetetrahydrofolate dehydrogenase/methenyltetrahydrofolate cyclohydrolase FolD [Clostridiales bacterium]|nr:bifunctional methylenetetrahydrofolate dehydrogenase/methenyltetrahydrofolate cyclohydrolase FolD [Clostridiales bacterium]MDY2873274.1 bifunctional methylenetetrahydrofolate dehydrogenase/methenyltetrahydrofolate cyclohydrolase FolD [Eubacteriales bacterium]
MAQLIDGKAIAALIRAEQATRAAHLKENGIEPALAVILVGEDPASKVYVRNKARACKECGIRSEVIRMSAETTQAELMAEIERVNSDPALHGLLIQLPLPAHLDEAAALAAVDWRKDVDGFHKMNAGALLEGEEGVRPCTPAGCMELLRRSHVPLTGANAVVVGRSNIVGKPMALMLLEANCTVTICHSRTRNLADIVKNADIVVAAVGRANFITGDMIKPGAAVIDVGINRREDGTLCGDVDFDAAQEKAGWITPVPGGVGPMTIAMLMKNTLDAAEKHGR